MFTYIYKYIHYTNNPAIESGNLDAYIHGARTAWES